MKQLVGHDSGAGTYAFNAAAKTITISGVSLTLEQILLVVDSTQATIIYALGGGSALGGAFNAGTGVLTLDYDTSAFSNTDHLQIYVDIPIALALEAGGNLAAIKADTDKIPAQGQALAAGSLPVVLPAAQITTLTPPAAITNFANETGGNLAAIKADVDKIPSQGQALSAGSMPVVLPAAQITTLTPPTAAAIAAALETGTALASASVPVALPTATITTLTPPAAITNFANETGGNLAAAKADLDTLAGAVSGAKVKVSAAAGDVVVEVSDGSNVIGTTAHPVKVDASATTQPVSGSVTAAQGSAAALTAGWPVVTGQTAESTAAWTSGTAGNAAVTLTVQGLNTVVVTLNQGTTITGGVVTFEVSDTTGFTNAYPILGAPSTTNQGLVLAGTFTLVASTNTAYTFNVAGWAAFRVRLSTVISGSGTVNVGVTASAAATVQAAYAVGGPAQYLSSGGAVTVTQANNPTDGSTAAYFTSSGGGSRVGAVQEFVATGPASVAANTAARRTPNFFKTAQATASGNTALWTPTSGKKFRLMQFMVQVTGNSTTSGGAVVTISFQDASGAIGIAMDVFIPSSSLGTGDDFIGPWVDLGNGFLSALANNVLNINLSAALTAGNVRVTCSGTEE